ncbi:hypothetical protein A9K55_003599 [Cordyceps militaris]|uniref:Uncharacterized protein n=1 Tax=Cordyceps militaris TaxID=73501 RepID=A0A2H4S5V4_CORMI|nr:hypothetical protein A9K55_003599 [Cordyceps militaris]
MAAKEPGPQPPRKWVPATVGICHWQTATDRFGPEAKAAIRNRERAALGLPALGHEVPFLWTPETIDQERPSEHSIYATVPAPQLYRNNLTALSQAYNLYFVAYQSQIYVYVPRSIARQRLPRQPDYRLRCEPSSVAPYIGSYIDRVVPHSINNLVAGFLGNEEALVACCDDGEVYAYYTREIAEWISNQKKSPLAHPGGSIRCKSTSAKPPVHFFRENVGISAWGLAIHRQSRMIAVSSNRREVTVFAFALENSKKQSPPPNDKDDAAGNGPAAFARTRSKNWRIILALGHQANNIPNICFMDDDRGEADKVCSIDIDGYTWISEIWAAGRPALCIRPSAANLRRSEENLAETSRAWGILALSNDSFLTVDTVEDLIGGTPRVILPVNKSCSQPMADLETCVRAIPDNPCPAPDAGLDRALDMVWPGQNALHAIVNFLGTATATAAANVHLGDDSGDEELSTDEQFDDEFEDSGAEDNGDDEDDADDEDDEDDEDDDGDDDNEANTENETGQAEAAEEVDSDDDLNELSAIAEPLLPEMFEPLHLPTPWSFTRPSIPTSAYPPTLKLKWQEMGENLVYYPHLGRIVPLPQGTLPLVGFLKQPREVSDSPHAVPDPASGAYRLVRMYEKDLELRSLEIKDIEEEKEIGIHCPDTLTLGSFHVRNMRPYFRGASRMSLILHVPELSLLIIGSPIGRVLLLTPTRLPSRQSTAAGYWSHGLRVEWVLPRASDDISSGPQRRPLHGVAVGPVQDKCGVCRPGSQHASIPRRYRLMLHYRNHDIATFEITRQEQTGKLCIF